MNVFKEFDEFAKNNVSVKKQTIPDHYRTLNSTPQSSLKEIKESYHELLKKYHHDINQSPDAARPTKKSC